MAIIPTLQAMGSVSAGQIVNNGVLIASFAKLNAAQIANIAVTQKMSEADLGAALNSLQLGLAKEKEIWTQYNAAAATSASTAATYAQAAGNTTVAGTAVAATVATGGFAAAVKGLTVALLASPLFYVGVAAATIYGIIKLVDALTVTFEEQKKIVSELKDEISSLQGEYDRLAAKDNLTESEERRLELLKSQLAAQKELLKIEGKRKERKQFTDDTTQTYTGGGRSVTHTFLGTRSEAYADVDEYKKALDDANKASSIDDQDKANLALINAKKSILDNIEALEDLKETNVELEPENQKLLDFLYESAYAFGILTQSSQESEDGLKNSADAMSSLSKHLSAAKTAKDAYNSVKTDLSDNGEISIGTLENLLSTYSDLNDVIAKYISGETDAASVMDVLSEKFRVAATAAGYSSDVTLDALNNLSDSLSDISAAQEAYNNVLADVSDDGEISLGTLKSLAGQYSDLRDILSDYIAGNTTASSVLDAIIKKYYEAADAAGYNKSITDSLTKSTDELIDAVQSSLQTLKSAYDEYKKTGEISVDTLQELVRLGPEYIDLLVDENGKINLNSDAVKTLLGEKTAYLKTLAAESVAAYAVATMNEMLAKTTKKAGKESSDAESGIKKATLAMWDMSSSGVSAAAGVDLLTGALREFAGQSGLSSDLWDEYEARVTEYSKKMPAIFNAAGNSVGGWTGGSGGGKTWAERQKEIYSDYVNDIEHAIFLLEKQEGTEQRRADTYKKLQDYVHAQANLFRKKGFSEESEYIQSLQKLWWSFADNIKSIMEDLAEKQKQKISEVLDSAKDQMDFFISISEHKMNMYEEDSDEYKAELDKQLSYYKEIQEATLKALKEYERLGLDETDEAVRSTIEMWWDAQSSIVSAQKRIYEAQVAAEKEAYDKRKKHLDEQQDALKDLLKLTEDLIRKEKEDQIEALEKQIDAYEEIINLKKESLRATKDEYDYQRSLEKKVFSLADLQSRITELSLDDSREAQAERIKLEEELASLQEDLTDFQHENSIKKQEDALDEELKNFKDARDKELAVIRDYLDRSGQLAQDAMRMIENSGSELYQRLMDYNNQYGDGMQSNVIDMWDKAISAIREYGSIAGAMSAEMGEFTPSAAPNYAAQINPPSYNPAQGREGGIIAQMQANSAAWHGASESERNRLHQENIRLASELGLDYNRDYNPRTGKWMRNGIPLYHRGLEAGLVGLQSRIGQNEQLAILKRGEAVLNSKDMAQILPRLNLGDAFNKLLKGGWEPTGTSVQNTVNIELKDGVTPTALNETRRAFERMLDDVVDNYRQRIGGRVSPQTKALRA